MAGQLSSLVCSAFNGACVRDRPTASGWRDQGSGCQFRVVPPVRSSREQPLTRGAHWAPGVPSSISAERQVLGGSSHSAIEQSNDRCWRQRSLGRQNSASAASLVLKSTDHVMTPLGSSRSKCDPGAFDVPRLGAPAREGQVSLKPGFETRALTLGLA